MERSEQLHRELKEIESQLERAKNQKVKLIADPEVQSTVISMIVAQNVFEPNDPVSLKLQGEVSQIKKKLYPQEAELTSRFKYLSKELFNLTRPVILKGIEKFQHELSPLKVERELISRDGGGASMIPRVELLTNEDAILEVRRITNRATETLHNMTNESIRRIQGYIEETLDAIHKVDLTPKPKWVDEVEYKKSVWLTSPVTQ